MAINPNIEGERIYPDSAVDLSTGSLRGLTVSATTYYSGSTLLSSLIGPAGGNLGVNSNQIVFGSHLGGASGGTVYADTSKISVGSPVNGGYNGSYGKISARDGGIPGHFILFAAEVSAFTSIASNELRGYGSGANFPMTRNSVYSFDYPGHYTGTTLEYKWTTRVDAMSAYTDTSNGTLVSTSGRIIDLIGQSQGNPGTRLDSIGFRIDSLSGIQANNASRFAVVGKSFFGSNTSATAFVDISGSTTAVASVRVRAGTTPVAPNDGDMWNDGSNLYGQFGGSTYQLSHSVTPSFNFADSEIPGGIINGSNTNFTTAVPYTANSTHLYVNGLRQNPGASNDYTESGPNQITLAVAPNPGDVLLIDYRY